MKITIQTLKKSLSLGAIFFALAQGVCNTPLKNKRGMCYNSLNSAEISALKGGVSWGYNWYCAEDNPEIGTDDFAFMPMVWGVGDDFEEILVKTEEYLSSHPNTKFLLGFNEPMMKNAYGGCDLIPHDAAVMWPRLENLAEKYDVALVSPALTWGFEPLTGNGKVYGTPESWMDEWISEYKALYGKEPRFDYLALHSYMDYPSAVIWFCDHYAVYFNKKVLLTEFCAWDSDQNQTPHKSEQGQVESMAQKVEALEADENVAGYAWFMSHAETQKIPFNSVFYKKDSDGVLTRLGKIYVNQSLLEKSNWFKTGEKIPAYRYVSSSNFNTSVGEKNEDGVRFNTPLGLDLNSDKKSAKTIPLEIGDFTSKRFANYQINVAEEKVYKLTVRYLADSEQQFFVSSDGKEIFHGTLKKSKKWNTITFEFPLKKGEQVIQLKSLGNAKSVKLSWFSFN